MSHRVMTDQRTCRLIVPASTTDIEIRQRPGKQPQNDRRFRKGNPSTRTQTRCREEIPRTSPEALGWSVDACHVRELCLHFIYTHTYVIAEKMLEIQEENGAENT